MEIWLIDNDYLGVRFQFNQAIVDQIRALENRRWNHEKKRWEVHLIHLPDLIRIGSLHPSQIDPQIFHLYRKDWIQTNLRVKINHIYTTLSGASIPFNQIEAATSFRLSGSEYNPKYIEGVWDGKRHLFNKRTYQFPTGLLKKILKILDAHQINYLIVDERISSSPSLNLSFKSKENIRKYQLLAIQKALVAKRGIIEMATGSGKTMVAAGIIAELNRPTIFFVHTRELLYQIRDFFHHQFGIPIGQLGDGIINLLPITVATIQTSIRALGGEYHQFDEEDEDDKTDITANRDAIIQMIESYPVVFFDECHHIPSDTCYSIAMQTKRAEFRYGLSATPYRADGHDLLIEAALGEKIIKINASMLIDEKYLVPPRIYFIPVPSNNTNYKSFDYSTIYQNEIVHNKFRNKLIAKKARLLLNQGLSVLILVQQVEHGKLLLRLLPEATFVHGTIPMQKRNHIWNELRLKNINLVIATTLADEGLDVPNLNALILASGGRSETRALQRVGRVLRRCEDKEEAIIIDFLDSAPYLKEHSKNRWKIYLTEPKFSITVENEKNIMNVFTNKSGLIKQKKGLISHSR
ncbi:MAG: DEAD/DEAH box helicase [bacterium]|nr:DEAD/DEAH box helicase [bacterium]